MREFIDTQIIQGLFGEIPTTWAYADWLRLAVLFVVALVIGLLVAAVAGMNSWLERRIAGRMQSRIGPNRNGPAGFLQWIADAVKLLFKEDLIPEGADRTLFRMAPYFVFVGFLLTFVAMPFSHRLIVADMNLGIFYIIAITALVVVGILMSGWASNSKWALFGGIRSAAQVISYEIPSGISLLIPVIMAGTLSTQGLIQAQGGFPELGVLATGGWPWNWAMFANPWAFCAFFIFFVSSLAEGNRTPFDLPEAESELVAGYFTEYSGIRFAIYFLTEWGNLFVMSALATILFLGGWQIPGVTPAQLQASWALEVVSLLVFLAKVFVLTLVVIWLRWTLPRIRVDQMMILCWKYLVPAAMVLLVFAALFEWLLAGLSPKALLAGHVGFFVLAGVIPFVLFVRQTFRNIKVVGDRVDLSNW